MEMKFSVGSGVTFGFNVGAGHQPEPEPAQGGTPATMSPVFISDGFVTPLVTPCGIATRQE